MYKRIVTHLHFWAIVAVLIGDGLFFGLTNPDKVPSIFLFVGYVLAVATVYWLLRGVFTATGWYGLPLKQRGKRMARLLTGFAALLLALQSIGQLGSRDVLVLLPLTVISYLYIAYGRRAAVHE